MLKKNSPSRGTEEKNTKREKPNRRYRFSKLKRIKSLKIIAFGHLGARIQRVEKLVFYNIIKTTLQLNSTKRKEKRVRRLTRKENIRFSFKRARVQKNCSKFNDRIKRTSKSIQKIRANLEIRSSKKSWHDTRLLLPLENPI